MPEVKPAPEVVKPTRGLLTWYAEGVEGGDYHSRVPHVPPKGNSGFTIGRGYDLRERLSGAVVSDLIQAGLPKEKAELIAKASGLNRTQANEFIIKNKLEKFEITSLQQKLLFEISYKQKENYIKGVCERASPIDGKKCEWDSLNPAIREMLVDLGYRGDYTQGRMRVFSAS